MRIKLIVVVVFLVSVFFACHSIFNGGGNDKVVAETPDSKLYGEQLRLVIPGDISKVDSIAFAQNYIEKWVRNQLLLEKAELNLDKETLDKIELMIENYKTSLMVYQYQQMLIQQKLDTVINDEQIAEYYAGNAGNFKLDSCVVKAIYVKLPKSTYNSYSVRTWMYSRSEESLISLEDYCYQNAHNFDMGENWVYFNQILRAMSKRIDNQESYLKHNTHIETQDSIYRYFVQILDYKLVNDTTPIDFVVPKIRNIILNQRKMQFINNLENNIYQDAVNHKRFTIYSN